MKTETSQGNHAAGCLLFHNKSKEAQMQDQNISDKTEHP